MSPDLNDIQALMQLFWSNSKYSKYLMLLRNLAPQTYNSMYKNMESI